MRLANCRATKTQLAALTFARHVLNRHGATLHATVSVSVWIPCYVSYCNVSVNVPGDTFASMRSYRQGGVDANSTRLGYEGSIAKTA
mgnify:CR=1 FL=1